MLYFAHVAGGGMPSGRRLQKLRHKPADRQLRRAHARRAAFIRLERFDGRAKSIRLTDSGREYAERTVARLYKAEADALEAWPEKWRKYIRLMEKIHGLSAAGDRKALTRRTKARPRAA